MRTVLRLFSLRPPCSPGCKESWEEAVSTKGILWWCLTHHSIVRKKYAEKMHECDVLKGGKMIRLGGWGNEVEAWKQSVLEIVDACN